MSPMDFYRQIRDEIYRVMKAYGRFTGFSIRFEVRMRMEVPIGIRIYVPTLMGLDIPDHLFNLPIEVRELAQEEWSKPPELPQSNAAAFAAPTALPTPLAGPARPPMAAGERVVCFKTTRPASQGMITGYLSANGKRWLLTANHVIANNGAALPFGPTEGIFGGFSPRLVGKTIAFEPVPDQSVGVATCDAAVCELNPATNLATPLYPAAWGMTDGHPVLPTEGQTIHFLDFAGREQTARVIDAQHTEFNFNIGLANTNTVTLKDHILVQGTAPLAPRGDSGSLAVVPTPGGMRPVGIVVLGPNPTTAVICPLRNVFQANAIRAATGPLTAIDVP